MAFVLDPHPYGCPICLGVTPSHMRDAITALCIKLQDVLRPSIHVINPSKGKSYPILNLTRPGEDRPRIVIFPGWEDDDESPKRRVGWGRQMTLLGRIAEARVRGETLQQYGASARSGDHTDPFVMTVARTSSEMSDVWTDIQDYLGDILTLRISEGRDATGPVPILSIYAADESLPRVHVVPTWRGAFETGAARLKLHELQELAARVNDKQVPERPLAEALKRRELRLQV